MSDANEKCAWTYDDIDDYYSSSCGHDFTFIDGECDFLFCPWCGKHALIPMYTQDDGTSNSAESEGLSGYYKS
jgi:hypothetical protein